MGGDLAPSFGGTKTFFADLYDTFSGKNFNFHAEKFLTTYFFSQPGFQILRFFTLLSVVYDLFFTRKTTISEKNSLIAPFFYSVRTFARIRQHYTSLNIGGPMHGPSPTSNFGGPSPHSPLGLRP